MAGLILLWIMVLGVGGCLLVGMSQRLSFETEDNPGLLPHMTAQSSTLQVSPEAPGEDVLSTSPVFVPAELTGIPLTQTVAQWSDQNLPTQTPLVFTAQPTLISTQPRAPTATWVIYIFTRVVPTSYYRTSTPRPTQTITRTRTITPTTTATAGTPTPTVTTTPTQTLTPTATTTVTLTPTVTDTATVTVTPSPAPVSTVIAFSGDYLDPVSGQDQTIDLLRVDEDGQNLHPILADSDQAWLGDWSPDGLKIVYELRQADITRLYTVSGNGADKALLQNQPEGSNSQAQWSPDGQWIVHVNRHADRNGAAANLWLTPVNGAAPIPLTSGSDQDIQPDWSPDGKTIVFVRNASLFKINVEEIYQPILSPQALLNALLSLFVGSSTPQAQVTALPLPLFEDREVIGNQPRFSPDGKYLLLTRNEDVLRLDLVEKTETNLTASLEGAARDPAWSPDGKWVACVIHSGGETPRDEIWLLSTTGETHRQIPLPDYLVEKHHPVWQP